MNYLIVITDHVVEFFGKYKAKYSNKQQKKRKICFFNKK